jgi:hypothetical protein
MSKEKRKHTRLASHSKANIKLANQSIEAASENLCLNEAFVAAASPVELNDVVAFTFSDIPISAKANVVRVTDKGIGFQFERNMVTIEMIPAMATIVQTTESSAAIRVAVVIEAGKIKPVWFAETDKSARDRIFVEEICSVRSHYQGSAKIINFAVTAGGIGYRLLLNTQAFTWVLGVVEDLEFPSPFTVGWGSFRGQE